MWRRQLVFAVASVSVLLIASCSNGNNSTASALSCTASGTAASGSATTFSNVDVSIINGTGPFSITLPGLPAVSSTSANYTYTSGPVAAGTVSVTDTSNSGTASCPISGGGAMTPGGGGVGGGAVTITPSATSVALGGSITLTATSTDGSSSFVFTQQALNATPANAPHVTISATGAASAIVTSSITTTVTILATGNLGATGTVILSFGAGSPTTGSGPFNGASLTCTLIRAGGIFYAGQTINYTIATSTGEQVEITSWNPGEPWTPTPPSFPLQIGASNNFSITYQWSGAKSVMITAQGLSTGGTCTMTDFLSIN